MRQRVLPLFLALVFFALPFISTGQPLNTQDSLALVDLYNSTNGPGWTNNTNWLTSAPASTWRGVNVSHGRVNELLLGNNNLRGPIPSSLGNLTAIFDLEINANGLTGTIPSSLGNIVAVDYLDLSQNQLTGSIPASFNNLKPNTSYSPIIRFHHNQLSGIIPAFVNFPYDPNGIDPIFDFSYNQFTFTSFTTAFIPFSPRLGADSPQASLPLLVTGNMLSIAAGGDVTTNIYTWYKDGSAVTTITGDSNYTPSIPGTYSVSVRSSLVPGLTLFSTSPLTNTQDSLALVDLYNSTGGPQWSNHTNWLTTAPLSTWYGVSAPNGRVIQLALPYNHLTGALPSSIGMLSALVDIELDNNSLGGPLPSTLGSLTSLHYLHIGYNQLTGAIPAELGSMTNCWEIELEENKLTGSIPVTLQNLQTLFDLDLSGNQLTGGIPSFNNRPNFNVINLSNNQLTGPLPTLLNDNMDYLEFEHNQLTDTIPATWCSMSGLTILNAGYNRLTGGVPPLTSRGLSWLMLSHNQLTGTIPLSLNNAYSLGTLELDSNQLTGPIPAAFAGFSQFGEYMLQDNHFNFSGMENLPVSSISFLSRYYPQANIPLTQNGNQLSVSAGGVLAQDTFRLYKDGMLQTTQIGDSVFTMSGPGRYNIVTTNSVAPLLTLYSDSIGTSLILPTSTTSAQQTITGAAPADITSGIFNIATLTPSGGTPLSGSVTALVTIDPAVSSYNSHPYVQRHYDITPSTNATTAQANVTLYFTQQDFDNYDTYVTANGLNLPLLPTNGSNNGNVIITQYHGTFTGTSDPANYNQGIELITPVVTWDAVNSWWSVSFPVTGFSGFFLSTGITPLPLTLLQFTALPQGRSVVLQWQTSNEVNTSQFIVQRSSNGSTFAPIGSIPAKSTPGENTYSFSDTDPLTGNNLYRLKMTDLDGNFTYSPVQLVKWDALVSGCFVYPNPAHNTASMVFNSTTANKYIIEIFDLSGRKLRRLTGTSAIGLNNIQLNVGNLAAGEYTILLTDKEHGRLSFRLDKE